MEKSTKIKPSWKNQTIFEENPSISMSSKIFVKIHAVLRKLCPMCPIAHVPYPPRSPSLSPVLTNIPLYPCALLPMCPIAHVPYPQGASPLCNINHPFTHVPHCPCVKKMSSCQKDVKLSKRCQMSKSQTHRL